MNQKKLLRGLDKWAKRREGREFDSALIRYAIGEIQELQRQLDLSRTELKELRLRVSDGLRPDTEANSISKQQS